MKKVILMTMGAALVMLSACNTVKGAGRDIQSVGKAGEEAIKQ